MAHREISIWLDFDIGDQVQHQEHGAGIVVEFFASARERGSECVRTGWHDAYYVVSFKRDWRKCQPWELTASAVASPQGEPAAAACLSSTEVSSGEVLPRGN